MTITATAAVQADWAPPRVELHVAATSPTPDNSLLSVVRVHSDGTRWPVIVPANLRLSSMAAVVFDNHPPRGMAFGYEVTCDGDTVTASGVHWVATAPNLMPVDAGSGGDARMLEWARSTGGLTVSPGAATVLPGETITCRDVPVEPGDERSVGVDVTGAATLGVQFRSGSVDLGLPATESVAGADRPVVTTEAPAGTNLLDIFVTNDSGSSISVSNPTLLDGDDYPAAAAPTTEPLAGPMVLVDDGEWLLHRIDPSLSVQVTLADLGGQSRQPMVGSFQVQGRVNRTHITGGVLHGATGQIEVRCDSDEQVARVGALLIDGGPILIATPGTPGWDIKWKWVQPTQVDLGNKVGTVGYPYRTVTIAWDETDQPTVVGVSRITYGGVKALFTGATYGDMKAVWATYRDAKTDTRIP